MIQHYVTYVNFGAAASASISPVSLLKERSLHRKGKTKSIIVKKIRSYFKKCRVISYYIYIKLTES